MHQIDEMNESFADILTAFGARTERVIINDIKGTVYYARLILAVENELQEHKIVEIDARPSDCIALATQQDAPIYVAEDVWDEVDDMSEVLEKMEEQRGFEPDLGGPGEEE